MRYTDLKKLLYMDSLIQRESTGTPEEFACKLGFSRATFFGYLSYMRNELMLDIRYNEYQQSYYYYDGNLCSVLGNKICSNCKKGLLAEAI